jgi:hypothetical protein
VIYQEVLASAFSCIAVLVVVVP